MNEVVNERFDVVKGSSLHGLDNIKGTAWYKTWGKISWAISECPQRSS